MAARKYVTEQDRIDAQTMEIKVQTVGSGYIQLPPQKRGEGVVAQPPTISHLDHPEMFHHDLSHQRPGQGVHQGSYRAPQANGSYRGGQGHGQQAGYYSGGAPRGPGNYQQQGYGAGHGHSELAHQGGYSNGYNGGYQGGNRPVPQRLQNGTASRPGCEQQPSLLGRPQPGPQQHRPAAANGPYQGGSPHQQQQQGHYQQNYQHAPARGSPQAGRLAPQQPYHHQQHQQQQQRPQPPVQQQQQQRPAALMAAQNAAAASVLAREMANKASIGNNAAARSVPSTQPRAAVAPPAAIEEADGDSKLSASQRKRLRKKLRDQAKAGP